jgi:hypothetical protein
MELNDNNNKEVSKQKREKMDSHPQLKPPIKTFEGRLFDDKFFTAMTKKRSAKIAAKR